MNNYVSLITNDLVSDAIILKSFYNCCPENIIGFTSDELELANKRLFDIIYYTSVDKIISILGFGKNDEALINSSNIPQYSSLDIFDDLLEIVETNPNGSYADFGYYFNKNGKIGAMTKYGENHYKLIAALGLFTINGPHCITHLGKAYMKLSPDIKINIREKLYLRILIVRLIMNYALLSEIHVYQVLSRYLSVSTMIRRRPNVRRLVEAITNMSSNKIKYDNNIIWK